MGLIPRVGISIDGEAKGGAYLSRLLNVRITDETGFISDSLEMTFDDRDLDLAIPNRGSKIQISTGYGDDLTAMGTFYVDDVLPSGDGLMRVLGKGFDTFSDMKTVDSRSYPARNLKALIEEVAKAYGLKIAVSDALKWVHFPEDKALRQHNESALHFLTRVCRDFHAVLKIQDDTLLALPRAEGKSISGKILPKFILDPSERTIKDWSARFITRPLYKSVEASAFSLDTGEFQKIEIGSGEPKYRFKRTFGDANKARQMARAKYLEFLRAGVLMTVEMGGRPEIKAEIILRLENFREKINGDWLVHSAVHDISPAKAYDLSLELEKLSNDSEAAALQVNAARDGA